VLCLLNQAYVKCYKSKNYQKQINNFPLFYAPFIYWFNKDSIAIITSRYNILPSILFHFQPKVTLVEEKLDNDELRIRSSIVSAYA
jgi:hypothetical protein